MNISVIVPCHGHPVQLRQLCRHLAMQSLADGERFEVIVAWDGPPGPAAQQLGTDWPFQITELPLARVGISAAKNEACAAAQGDVFLFVNDDVLPEPNFIHEHAAAHAKGHEVVLGSAPWQRYDVQTLFDEMIAGTRMIFFYGDLHGGESYNFRHAWNLNLSVSRRRLQGHDGPFRETLRPCMYEDLEMAFRLLGDQAGVYYHPTARAMHEHRYTLASYLRREAMLGVMAPVFWEVSPECFLAVFGATLDELIANAESGINVDLRDAERCLQTMVHLAGVPSPASPAAHLLDALYVAHLPLKRRAFRCGLLAALREPARAWEDRPAIAANAIAHDGVLGRSE